MSQIILTGPIARQAAHRAIDAAPEGYSCEVKERTRTSDQNALLHALLSDIARQAQWAGKKRDLETWKCLMVSAHRIATNQLDGGIQGLEDEFVQLRKSTAAMGVRELGSLIDYLTAWATMNNVRLSAPERDVA